jgi:hypothetical protein
LAFCELMPGYRLATPAIEPAFCHRNQPNAHRICRMPNNARVLSRYPPYGAARVCCLPFFEPRPETRKRWASGLFSQNIKEVYKMRKTLALLLVVACLFGVGSALGAFTPEPAVAGGPLYPPPIVPPLEPPDQNSIVAGGPLYPPPIVPPLEPPDQNSIIVVAGGPLYPPPIVPPLEPPDQNSITG